MVNGAFRNLVRTWRHVYLSRNPLARSWDRFEAAVLTGVVVGALFALPLAAVAGSNTYAQQMAVSAAQRAARHPATATLLTNAPLAMIGGPIRNPTTMVKARVLDRGVERIALVKATPGTPAGTTIQIWLTGSGNRAPTPKTATDAVITAVLAGLFVWLGMVILLAAVFWNTRWRLDRLRAAQWDREWALMSRQWTRS
jgi:hypothetical protein